MKAVSKEMRTKRPTIYDVAKRAGVSPATVSRVINTPALVHSDTRQRILHAIESLQFVPKAEAVAKARQQFKRIAVLAPFFTEPSFMERLKGISQVLSSQHYELVIYAVQSNDELYAYIDMLELSKRVDGLICLCLNLDPPLVQRINQVHFPVCCVEQKHEGLDCICIDNHEGGRMSASYLYEKGKRMPGFIGEASALCYVTHSTEQRLAGFASYFQAQGIELKHEHIWLGMNDELVSEEGILNMLGSPLRPDCIFASSDILAIRLVKCALHLGLRIPDDLAVVGFDDIEIAKYVNLTTIDQSLVDSGSMAAQMLRDRLRNPDRPIQTSTITLKLSVRGSA